jgi:hypothetical protein
MIKLGWLANTMSFLVKHSSAKEGDQMTRTLREPKWRKIIGPCRVDLKEGIRFCKEVY